MVAMTNDRMDYHWNKREMISNGAGKDFLGVITLILQFAFLKKDLSNAYVYLQFLSLKFTYA